MKKITEQKELKPNVIEFAFRVGQVVYYEEADTGKIVEGQVKQMIFNGMDRVYKLYDDNPIPAELVDGVIVESALSAETNELSDYAKERNRERKERLEAQRAEALAALEAANEQLGQIA